MKNNNFLKAIPEFSTAIKNITENGFFTLINPKLDCNESDKEEHITFEVEIKGKIPVSKEDMSPGINQLINADELLLSLKKRIEQGSYTIYSFSFDEKSEDWERYNKSGTKKIGVMGTEKNLKLSLIISRKK